MEAKQLQKLKRDIVKLLKKEKLYESTDLVLVDELIYNLTLIDQAKQDIAERGININLRKDDENPFYQLNNSLSIIQKSTAIIQRIYAQLGIDAISRMKSRDKRQQDNAQSDALNDLKALIGK